MEERVLRVPRRFAEATMEGLSPEQKSWVREYVEDFSVHLNGGRGLLLSGPPGVGKTWAIVALTRAFLTWRTKVRRFPDYEFVTAPDMFDNMGEFGELMDVYRQRPWMSTYSKVPWLVINDLGKEHRGGKLSEVIPNRLGRILRARSERRLVTHVTTNLRGDEMVKIYGESIMSLLTEMMRFYSIRGKDRRKQA